MERVRVGVIGLGWIAQVAHIPVLQKLPEADLAAVCDRDRGKARLVAEKFGLKKVYTDLRQMLDQESLDAVIVSTSTDAHKEAAMAAIQAGTAVLVEKPIARTSAEATAIAEAAAAAKVKVMVGMNHRFRPDTMILKSLIEGKELGKIFYTKTGWLRRRTSDSSWTLQKEKAGGGVFIDLGIVMLDLALWMMGYPVVTRVSATTFSHATKGVEDTAIVSLHMKDGTKMSIEVSWSMAVGDDQYYCDVYGTGGSATLTPLRIHKELHGNLVNMTPTKIESPQTGFKRSYENEIKHFLGAVRELHGLISPADEAVSRMRLVEAIYRSAKLKKEVTLS
jgi:predicted dehydrogenase